MQGWLVLRRCVEWHTQSLLDGQQSHKTTDAKNLQILVDGLHCLRAPSHGLHRLQVDGCRLYSHDLRLECHARPAYLAQLLFEELFPLEGLNCNCKYKCVRNAKEKWSACANMYACTVHGALCVCLPDLFLVELALAISSSLSILDWTCASRFSSIESVMRSLVIASFGGALGLDEPQKNLIMWRAASENSYTGEANKQKSDNPCELPIASFVCPSLGYEVWVAHELLLAVLADLISGYSLLLGRAEIQYSKPSTGFCGFGHLYEFHRKNNIDETSSMHGIAH